ncbi:MAG TPA: L-threonylcarbamoyladenylate synthase [Methanobacterium sp.]|jgi:L-threonylcarbamoyladenylate synthase|nr:MAG: threonylcarbamoyl-AMP synthase [Methanobacterium sp.]HOI70660.1 L-threonylcarbamoyladenylate synthase [Methanobacterium sp.]HPX78183.1 L-threonylcarbamoyladenylate synthase [Methanobacterium sp.]
MKIIRIDPQNPEKRKIKMAVNILEEGGLIVYPTDTIYGLGANIFSDKAIRKVYSIKGRDYSKPISVSVSEIEDINKIAYLENLERVKEVLPGPFTIILNKKENVSPLLTAGGEKIGVRIPDNRISRELTRKFPITSTSANLSGGKVFESADAMIELWGDSVDLIIDGGKLQGNHSTVIDWTTQPPKVLRKGVKEFKL